MNEHINRQSFHVSFGHGFPHENADSATAAAVVQQEMNNVQALKRLSIGAMSTLDPDLPQQLNWFEDKSSKSPPISPTTTASNSEELRSPTSPTSAGPVSPSSTTSPVSSLSSTINPSHASQLLWVPAHVHPEIAPQEWKSFVQNKVAEIKATVPPSSSSIFIIKRGAILMSTAGQRPKKG